MRPVFHPSIFCCLLLKYSNPALLQWHDNEIILVSPFCCKAHSAVMILYCSLNRCESVWALLFTNYEFLSVTRFVSLRLCSHACYRCLYHPCFPRGTKAETMYHIKDKHLSCLTYTGLPTHALNTQRSKLHYFLCVQVPKKDSNK